MVKYQIIIAIATLISLSLSIYTFKIRKVKSVLIFSLLMLFITIFTAGSFFELSYSDIKKVILWRNICQIGYLLAVPTLFVLVLDYIGKEDALKPMYIVLIYTFPITEILLKWTDNYHHLMRKDALLENGLLLVSNTPLAYVFKLIDHTMVIIAVLMIIVFYGRANSQYRKQMITIVTGIMIPMAVEMVKTLKPQMVQVLPPTSVTFAFTGIITFWSIFRYELFSVVPIARDKIMENIQEGIMIVDDLGRLIDKNAALDGFIVDITGGMQEILGKSVDSLLSDWPRWLTACKDMCADEFEIDSSVLGAKRYYRLRVYPLNEKGSKIRGTVSILSDITESRLREYELISSSELTKEQLKALTEELIIQKKQLEAIFENMSDHCVVVDKAGKYIKVNKAAHEFIPSIKASEVGDWLKYTRCYDILGNEINDGTIPAVRLINGETFSNYRLIVKNSDQEVHFDVNGTPVYDEKGDFLFGILCSHDVTALVTHEKEIMVKNEQLETIINTMSDMAILSISDREGNFLYYSNSANGYFDENTFNVKAGSTYRKGEYLYEDGSVIELVDMPVFRVLRGEKVTNFHFIRKTPKGEIHFLFNGTPIYDMEGTLTHGVYFNMDITEQVQHKRMVPAMEQLATLNALKDKLFTVVTHDIRNPLATLVSMMELLEGEKEHYSGYQEILTSARKQIKNTYFMVENLLDWFRSQKDNLGFSPNKWSLSKIACEAVNVYQNNAEAKGIQIYNNIDEDVTVFADKDMLEFVLRNLVNNAIKYTGSGGVITLQANKSGKEVIVSISDNGVGIDIEKAKTLFNLADASSTIGTAGEKGTGLGLLICKEFAEHNDGELWLESIPGEGSTFYFSIPSDDGSKDGQLDE